MSYEPLPRPLRWLYFLYYWLFFAPLTFLVITPFFFSMVFVMDLIYPPLAPRVGVPWARCIALLIPSFIRRHGFEQIDPKQSYVVVSSHHSQSDIIALYAALPIDFRWVMKQELRPVPMIGPGCAKMGHVFVDRSNHERAIASLNAAREKLVDGVSILFFPEGTRSHGAQLLPFKKGAFRMAIDLQLPLLPITLCGTDRIMPPTSFILQRPGFIDIFVHPPISVEGLTHDDIEALMAQTHEVISSKR